MRKPGYRADIDGLRAVAIIAVIIYHVAPARLPHGYLGVDIFFVISGFLITRIILDNLQAGTFSFLHFLARRAARLFPALLAVFALTTPLAFIILTGVEMRDFLHQLIAGALYVSNIHYYMQSGYFEPDAIRQPFLHLWSLAVEEQFYLLIPPLLLLAWRFGGLRAVGLVLALLAAASLASALLVHDTALAFFITWFRAWEFIAGGLLAWAALRHGWQGFSRPAANALAPLALLLLILVMLNPWPARHPGGITILAVLATMLLVASPASALSRYLLSWRPAVFVGLISYSLYLWHYPLLSLTDYALAGGLTTREQKLIYLAIVVLLAVATYRLIERPARLNPLRTARLVTPLLLIFAAGALLLREARVSTLVTDEFLVTSATAARDWRFPGGLHQLPGEEQSLFVNLPGRPVEVVFIGDSHARQYAPRVMKLTRETPARMHVISFATGAGCPPVEGFVLLDGSRDCEAARQRAFRHLQRHAASIEKVIIAGAWNRYLFDTIMLRQRQARLTCDGRQLDHRHPDYADCLQRGMQAFLDKLRRTLPRAKIVFLLDNPMDARFSPRYHLRRGNYVSVLHSHRIANALGLTASTLSFDDLPTFERAAAQLALSARLRRHLQSRVDAFYDPATRICPGNVCKPLFRTDNGPWYKYWDNNHMTATYAETFDMLDHLLLKTPGGSLLTQAGGRR